MENTPEEETEIVKIPRAELSPGASAVQQFKLITVYS